LTRKACAAAVASMVAADAIDIVPANQAFASPPSSMSRRPPISSGRLLHLVTWIAAGRVARARLATAARCRNAHRADFWHGPPG
jgi:hypothetical protein